MKDDVCGCKLDSEKQWTAANKTGCCNSLNQKIAFRAPGFSVLHFKKACMRQWRERVEQHGIDLKDGMPWT